MNEEHIDYELLFNELCAKYDVLRTENEELRSSNTVLRDNNEELRTKLGNEECTNNNLIAINKIRNTRIDELHLQIQYLGLDNNKLRAQLEELRAWLDEINQYRIELEFCPFPIEQWLARRPKNSA